MLIPYLTYVNYFFVCAKALAATDFESLLYRLSLKILDAFVATDLLVCLELLAIFSPPFISETG